MAKEDYAVRRRREVWRTIRRARLWRHAPEILNAVTADLLKAAEPEGNPPPALPVALETVRETISRETISLLRRKAETFVSAEEFPDEATCQQAIIRQFRELCLAVSLELSRSVLRIVTRAQGLKRAGKVAGATALVVASILLFRALKPKKGKGQEKTDPP